jgi:hypothetical protein
LGFKPKIIKPKSFGFLKWPPIKDMVYNPKLQWQKLFLEYFGFITQNVFWVLNPNIWVLTPTTKTPVDDFAGFRHLTK